MNDKAQDSEKQHELRKHRSMEYLLKQEEHPEKQKTGKYIHSKIDEFNKKLTNIREAIKKSTDHPRESLEHFISREKEKNKKPLNNCMSPPKNEEQNYLEEVIFEKKEDQAKQEKYLPQRNSEFIHKQLEEFVPKPHEDDRESVDTYLQ